MQASTLAANPAQSRIHDPLAQLVNSGSLAEVLRRLALVLAAALIVARACWPGEVDDEWNSAQGMGFTVLMLVSFVLTVFSSLIGRRWSFRFSGTDAAVLALFLLMVGSSAHAADRRISINLAWQLVPVGLAYLQIRWLPRSSSENSALATLLFSIATALACYGLYQTIILRPVMIREYRKNPAAARQTAGVAEDPAARRQFEDRLLGSKEPTATFALANSLAGFLLLPTLLALAALAGQRRTGLVRVGAGSFVLMTSALAVVLACFLLTKSRTGYAGFLVGIAVILWTQSSRLPRRVWIGLLSGLAVLLTGLIILGPVSRQLDREVLLQAGKSLRFRSEYWIATLRMIQSQSAWWWVDIAGWWGTGLGNFAGPYLRYKLPEASEGVRDPHNLFLEVWATAGLLAMLVLIAAVGLGFSDLFGRGTLPFEESNNRNSSAPPQRWLLVAGGLGGWVLAMLIRPDLSPFSNSFNPFEGDWMRWAVLLAGGGFGALAFGRVAPSPVLLQCGAAAGFVATVVHLLAAGGITYPPVALMLWIGLALGMNLRVDRACGTLYTWKGWGPAFALGAIAASVAGVFAGTMLPYFQAQTKIEEGREAVSRARRMYQLTLAEIPNSVPRLERARRAFEKSEHNYLAATQRYSAATRIDPYSRLPWILWADLDLKAWEDRGATTDASDLIWHKIDSQLLQAATPPRDPYSLQAHMTRVRFADKLLTYQTWPPFERERILKDRVDAIEKACLANPTSASLHAERAQDLATLARYDQALAAGTRALDLDRITPHVDKKLPKATRAQIQRDLETWKAASAKSREAKE